jgi:hypothetical protein
MMPFEGTRAKKKAFIINMEDVLGGLFTRYEMVIACCTLTNRAFSLVTPFHYKADRPHNYPLTLITTASRVND